MYLPYPQTYALGYVAFHRPDVTAYFDEHVTHLPLRMGDAVVFNPALFHAAGTNQTADVRRMANLQQVSSAFRAMETVHRAGMCFTLYPTLMALRAAGTPERALRNVVAESAEGYAFPTNLDREQPIGGKAPATQADLVWRALQEGWSPNALDAALADHHGRRHAANQ